MSAYATILTQLYDFVLGEKVPIIPPALQVKKPRL